MQIDKTTTVARNRLSALLPFGAALTLVGGIVLAMNLPSNDPTEFGPDTEGSTPGVVIGALLAWGGSAMVLVALIGYGVWLGREASPSKPVDDPEQA